MTAQSCGPRSLETAKNQVNRESGFTPTEGDLERFLDAKSRELEGCVLETLDVFERLRDS